MNGNLNDYHRLFDAIDAMLFVISFDGVILAVNKTTISRLGYARDELIGNSVRFLHPQGTDNEVCNVLSLLATTEETVCYLPLVAKDGHEIDVETRIYKGSWEGDAVLFGFAVDITKQKATEMKCEAIFRLSPMPVLVSSLSDGRIIDVNDAWCELVDRKRDDVLGKSTIDIGIWTDITDRRNMMEQLQHTTTINGYPVRLNRSDGGIVFGLLSGTRMKLNGEDIWITCLVDHTEQYLLEQQLDEIRELALTSALEQLDKQFSKNKYVRLAG